VGGSRKKKACVMGAVVGGRKAIEADDESMMVGSLRMRMRIL
jgi:hypothetical protein